MKKAGMVLIAVLVVSMMAMLVVPVLAARTPKNDQVLVKVLDSSTGKGIHNAAVLIYQQNGQVVGAQSNNIYTKGNGVAVISLIDDTYFGTWNPVDPLTVRVSAPGYGTFSFEPYYFVGTNSADITISIPPP